jgi:hypothetical protein
MTRTLWLTGSLWTIAACSTPTAPEAFVPPPPAPYQLEVRQGISHEVAPGEVLAVDLLVRRDQGFQEPITFSSIATPGIVVVFRPATVLHRDDTDLLIVADQTVTPITHDVHLVGKVAGKADRSVVLKLTVTADE